MTDKIEFPGVTIDASEPVRMDYRIHPDKTLSIGQHEYTSTIQFHSQDQGKCVMRLSKDGLWVDPDLPTDEAAKAVIEALDVHIKLVTAQAYEAGRKTKTITINTDHYQPRDCKDEMKLSDPVAYTSATGEAKQ